MRLSTVSSWTRLLLGALLLLLLCGCGGGSPVSKKNGKGSAVFTIKWPAVQKKSRLIPAAANLIRIQMVPNADGTGTPYASQDAIRPQTGNAPLLTTPTTTLTFNNLPPGQLYATATAYPETAPPLSIAQAKAIMPLTIADGQITQSSLTLGTTITQVLPPTLAGSSQTTGRFTPFLFTPQAKDSGGNVVLVAPTSLQVTVSNSSVATLTGSNPFSVSNAGKLGTVTVTTTETESGVAQSFSLTFLPAIYIADGNNSRIVRMDDMNGTNFTAFGTGGSGIGHLQIPRQIAVDSQNRIYIADDSNNRIVRIDDIGGTGFTTYGLFGSMAGQINNPYGVAADAQTNIYLGDTSNHRVVRIDDFTGSNFQAFGTGGNSVGQFSDPVSIALDSRNRIYIADYNNNRIVRIDNITGANFTAYGTFGSNVGEFNDPFGVAVDAQDRIYIGDIHNNRIVRIDDMTGANFISYDASTSSGGRLSGPVGIAFDAQNRIYIADEVNNRIVRIDDMSGTNFIAFGTLGSGIGNFHFPKSIVVR